jgi:putative ABC transport system ATP-binding protein
MSTDVVVIKNVGKTFATANGPLEILKGVSFSIKAGEKVAIIGPSGSGKSTLLSLIGLLDKPTSGSLQLSGIEVGNLSDSEQATFRNKHIGFIFQNFELVQAFTAAENIASGLEIGGKKEVTGRTNELLLQLGIQDRADAMPRTLSGGEKQRVAIGRALAPLPEIILADEPTGSLDRVTGERVLNMLIDAVSSANATLIVITHDATVAEKMDRVFELKDYTIYERT